MVTIREAQADDFARVYPLLLEFKDATPTEEQWRQLFIDHSGLQDGCFGQIVLDDGEVVGFLALTFSERTIRGQKRRFCNMSNWIVKSAYRGQSLGLLARVLALENVTITNLSPTPGVLKMCQKLGFKILDQSQRVVLPVLDPRKLLDSCEILTDPAVIEASLEGEARKICRDHRLPYHKHLLVRSDRGDCYVMFNRSPKLVKWMVRVPVARVHHVSAPDVFLAHLDRIAVAAAVHFRTVAMVVEERILRGHRPWHSFARPGGGQPGAFKSKDGVRPEEIDGLYSECVLLNY